MVAIPARHCKTGATNLTEFGSLAAIYFGVSSLLHSVFVYLTG